MECDAPFPPSTPIDRWLDGWIDRYIDTCLYIADNLYIGITGNI